MFLLYYARGMRTSGYPLVLAMNLYSTIRITDSIQEKSMKSLKKVCAAVLLTLIISLTTLAGDMSCGITAPPPQQSQAATTGDISAGIASADKATGDEAMVANSVTEIALNLMQSVLSLF
jgi:hypothetical protein